MEAKAWRGRGWSYEKEVTVAEKIVLIFFLIIKYFGGESEIF